MRGTVTCERTDIALAKVKFHCPELGQPDDYRFCCGQDDAQVCCNSQLHSAGDDDVTTCPYPQIITIVWAVSVSVLVVCCICICWWYCGRKRTRLQLQSADHGE